MKIFFHVGVVSIYQNYFQNGILAYFLFYFNTLLSQNYSVRFHKKKKNHAHVQYYLNPMSTVSSVDKKFHGNRKARYANIKNLI